MPRREVVNVDPRSLGTSTALVMFPLWLVLAYPATLLVVDLLGGSGPWPFDLVLPGLYVWVWFWPAVLTTVAAVIGAFTYNFVAARLGGVAVRIE